MKSKLLILSLKTGHCSNMDTQEALTGHGNRTGNYLSHNIFYFLPWVISPVEGQKKEREWGNMQWSRQSRNALYG